MKNGKIVGLLVASLVCASSVLAFAACDKSSDEPDKYSVPDALQINNDLDYAATVDLNTADYPVFADQGLKIVSGFGTGAESASDDDWGAISEVDADGVDQASGKSNVELYFDATKPTLIIIHGVQFGVGRYGVVHMLTENRTAELSAELDPNPDDYFDRFGTYAGEIDMAKYWHDMGYNVMYFHYERFADTDEIDGSQDMFASLSGSLSSVFNVTDMIWSSENVKGVYTDGDGNCVSTTLNEAFNGKYSVAEFFAAEYLRTMKKVDQVFPDYKSSGKEIYTAAHSMGGVMNTASTLLIKLLAEKGQLDMRLTPCRMFQMDSFIGLSSNRNVSWSGKQYLDNSETETYTKALEILVNRYDVAVGFYLNEGGAVPFMLVTTSWSEKENKFVKGLEFEGVYMDDAANRILAVSAMVTLRPYYADVADPVATNGHNPIREWVLSSLLYDEPTVEKDGTTYVVPTSKTSTATLKTLKGHYFIQDEPDGNERFTVRCDDDSFALAK